MRVITKTTNAIILLLLLPLCAMAEQNNGYEWVDLGLPSGTKWATCNLGASSPEEYGQYFAWGETTGYTSLTRTFDWTTYELCNGTNTSLTSYCTNQAYGTVDNKTKLINRYDNEYWWFIEDEDGSGEAIYGNDDAASDILQGVWMIPTEAQMEELKNNVTYTNETLNGVKGRRLTSKLNGKSIFIPFGGYFEGDEYKNPTIYANYWTSSLFSDCRQAKAYWTNNSGAFRSGGIDRCCALPIRPVCNPATKIELSETKMEIEWAYDRPEQYYNRKELTVKVYPATATVTYPIWTIGDWEIDTYPERWYESPIKSGNDADEHHIVFEDHIEYYYKIGSGSDKKVGEMVTYTCSLNDGSNLSTTLTVETVTDVKSFEFEKPNISLTYNPNHNFSLGFNFIKGDSYYNIDKIEYSNNKVIELDRHLIPNRVDYEAKPRIPRATAAQFESNYYLYGYMNGTGTTDVEAMFIHPWSIAQDLIDNDQEISSDTPGVAIAICTVVVKPGKCGDNLEYTVDYQPESKTYTVDISGSGDMYDFNDTYFGLINEDYYHWDDEGVATHLIINFDTETITSIGKYAFSNCLLESIHIPNSIKAIKEYAFADSFIPSIYVGSTIPTIFATTFSDEELNNATLYVPKGRKSAYQNAAYWSSFKNIVEYDNNIDISDLDNALYIEPVTARIGGKAEIPVKLKNAYPVKGFQFSLTLPQGASVSGWNLCADRLPVGASISNCVTSNQLKDGKYSVACALNYNDETFVGNDGTIATVTLNFADTMEEGDYELHLSACDIANSNNVDEDLPDTYSTLTLEKILLGDANQDGKVRIGDATAILNYIVGVVSGNFSEKAADANEDGKIRIGDATAVLNIIVNQ